MSREECVATIYILKGENPAAHDGLDILPAVKREDSHGAAPLGWDGYGL